MTERGPRGKYSRLLCRGCRSRKIKCALPDPHNLGPLNTPQPAEKACERCRNLNLECEVDYTLLKRPQYKRARPRRSQERSPNSQSNSADDYVPTLSSLDIKPYLFADEDDNILSNDDQTASTRALRKEEIFLSMTQSNNFILSILEKDRLFGSDIVRATSSWTTPLSDLIGHEMAASLDRCLVWHRFFLPKLPTLVSIRNRLISEEATTNCATRLLFALLASSAFEMSNKLSREDRRLKENLQLAVSFYGQEFIFSPPTHQESVVVALFVSDYKPAAMATIQAVAHKTIDSKLYMNIAYEVYHRLESVAEDGNQGPDGPAAIDYDDFERWLFDSIQAFQIIASHATVDNLARKPLRSLEHLTGYMKVRVDVYQNALETRQCTPRAIYWIQWATSTYILFGALTDLKKSLDDPGAFIMIAEETERACFEQISYTNSLLDTLAPANDEETQAVRSLSKLRFCTVSCWGIAFGMLYTSVLGARPRNDMRENSSDISSDEAIRLTSKVVDVFTNPDDPYTIHFRAYLIRFGATYPKQLMAILETFIECTKMELSGIRFRPPPRSLGLECISVCKNLLENNIVRIKSSRDLHPEFSRQLDLFQRCAEQLTKMASSSGTTTESAFAGGCVYALCSKLIIGFIGLMEKLRTDFGSGNQRPELPLDNIIASAAYDGLSNMGSGHMSNNLDTVTSCGTFGQMEGLPFVWAGYGDPGFQPEVWPDLTIPASDDGIFQRDV